MGDVHTSHCCAYPGHGCKYSDEHCSVVQGYAPQEHPCESCGWAEEETRPLKNILDKHIQKAKHEQNHSDIHLGQRGAAKVEALEHLRQDLVKNNLLWEMPKFIQRRPDRADLTKLSKFMSLILRHKPEQFGLELNEDGFVFIELFMYVLKNHNWTEADMRTVVASCDKQRFQIAGDKIRARYGHSVDETIRYPEVDPPEFLYHGTSQQNKILKEGLKSMNRQYVHLSPDIETARKVGLRHTSRPIILSIEAKKAKANGIKFYDASDATGKNKTYLVKNMPAEFISILENK